MKWFSKKQEPVPVREKIEAQYPPFRDFETELTPMNIIRAKKSTVLHLTFADNPTGDTRCQREIKDWVLAGHFDDDRVLKDLFYGEPRKRWFAETFPDYTHCSKCFFLG